MPFVTVGDIRLYYEIRGSGPRLLCFAGTGWDLRRAPTVFQTPIAGHFETMTFDQRGLGQSSKPDIPYSMADYADDANGLLDAIGWESCLVMGISFGGMVAQEFALRYPQRVRRLVLVCSSSGGAGGTSYPLHTLADIAPEEYARRTITLADTRRDTAWQMANAEAFHAMVQQTAARWRLMAEEEGSAAGVRRQLEARAAHDTYERLPQLKMPVFICGGRYDGITSSVNLEAMQRRIAGAVLELFEGGHQFYLQDTRAAERIVAFLEGR
jgi:3-oxoadipate enol-lactonase